MRFQLKLLPAAALFSVALGCGDGGTGPADGGDGPRLAAQFERLADSVAEAGYSPTAEALRHAAEVVRLTGHATPVNLTIDGAARSFLAVAEQLDFPLLECVWPADSGVVVPPDKGVVVPDSVVPVPAPTEAAPAECTPAGTHSMRTLIAWEPEHMAEVVRIVADLGSAGVQTGVPDVMTGLPTSEPSGGGDAPTVPGDSGGGFTGYPGFMGEYLVRDVGSWWAVEGTQENALESAGGGCTADRTTFDWAELTCEAARFRFGFSMRVEALRYEPLAIWAPGNEPPSGGAEGTHTLALPSTAVDGVRLTVVGWSPPPLPPPGPLPPDSTVVHP
ncbi:MAG TPA: hypothetical protein VFU46_03450 [Gemmatimonadales bacterium]|nr:hypothetical protein [Gemmatimonadales bacterium]